MSGRGGIVIVDKPRGPTSHDVVARLRKTFGTRQVGHAGTLDPMATGVLVVAVDEATKLVPWLTSEDKAYDATVRFGIETDTLDAEGKETDRIPPSPELLAAIASGREMAPLAAAMESERARTSQIPPAYSAIKIDGVRAHAIARSGAVPELAAREVQVRSLSIAGAGDDPTELRLQLDVGKGYFVRSLARDLAAALGTVGHLVQLRRTRSGAFGLDEAISLEAGPDAIRAALVPLDHAAMRALPTSVLSAGGVIAAGHGKRIALDDLRDGHRRPSAWMTEDGRLVAVGEIGDDALGRVLRGFPRA